MDGSVDNTAGNTAAPKARRGPIIAVGRVAAVHVPDFPLRRCVQRRPGLSGRPFGLIAPAEARAPGGPARAGSEHEAEERALLGACSPAALAAGVRPGMRVLQALAICPELVALPALDVEAELGTLAEALGRFSPRVALATPDGLLLDLAGLHGAEEALLGEMRLMLRAQGLPARAASASGPLCAAALARSGGKALQVVGPAAAAAREALAPLALEAFLPPEHHGLLEPLRLVGVRRVGDLARLPGAGVLARFGAAAARLHRAALGREDEAFLQAWTPPAEVVERLELDCVDTPVAALEPLLFLVRRCLGALVARLRGRGLGLSLLELRLEHDGGGVTTLSMGLGRPTLKERALLNVCQLKLGDVTLPAPVVALQLRAAATARLRAVQFDLYDRAVIQREALDELLPRLAAAIGEGQGGGIVAAPLLRDRHRPEATWEARPFDPEEAPAQPPLSVESDVPAPPRPLRLLATPRRLERRPEGLLWGGRLHRVLAVEGPERLSGEWWREGCFDRDYYRVRVEGGGVWWVYADRLEAGALPAVGRLPEGALYLHGLFD